MNWVGNYKLNWRNWFKSAPSILKITSSGITKDITAFWQLRNWNILFVWYLILKCNSFTFKPIGKQTGTEIVARSEPVKYVLSVNSGVPHSLIYPVNLKRFCNKCSMAGSQSGSTIWNFLLKWQIYGNCNKINSFKFSAFVFEPGAKSTLPILLFRIISSKCPK